MANEVNEETRCWHCGAIAPDNIIVRPPRISPHIRFAVERALRRANSIKDVAEKEEAANCGVSLQGEAWRDDCDCLETAVEILRGLE